MKGFKDIKEYFGNHKLQIISELCQTFFKNEDRPNRASSAIYVDAIYHANVWGFIYSILFAKGLQENENIEIIALREKSNNQIQALFSAFGCSMFYLRTIRGFCSVIISALYDSTIIFYKYRSGNKLLGLVYHDILLGRLIYDEIVRHTELNTVECLRGWKHFKMLLFAICNMKIIEKKFKEKPPKYYLPIHTCYLDEVYVELSLKYGAEVIQVCLGNPIRTCVPREKNLALYLHDNISCYAKKYLSTGDMNNYAAYAEEKLGRIFKGIGNRDVVNAYKNKETISRADLKRINENLDLNKKNIVIMAHCFKDYPHTNRHMIYKDYYDWLCETIRIVSDIDNVNWIVKAHPSRKLYNEEQDGVLKLVHMYGKNNVIYFPDEYSTSSLGELADAIVTVAGTAGIEFSCMGIPVVVSGTPFYSGFGFTIDCTNVKQYKEVLTHMDRIKRLNDNQIQMARKVLYAADMAGAVHMDSLEKLLWGCYQRFLLETDHSIGELRNINDEVFDAVYNWGMEHSLTSSQVYQLGKTWSTKEE